MGIYAKRTGQTEDALDELMSDEEWIAAEETLDWGFIDEIFEPAPGAMFRLLMP